MDQLWSGPSDWLAVLAVLAGVAALIMGRRGWRRDDKLHCRRCLHSLVQAVPDQIPPGASCPECGHRLGGARGTRQTIPSTPLQSIGLIIASLAIAFWLWNGAAEGVARLVLPRYKVETTQMILDSEIRVLQPRWPDDSGSPRVEIRQSGQAVFCSELIGPVAGGAVIGDGSSGIELHRLLWVRSEPAGPLGSTVTFVFEIGAGLDDHPRFIPWGVLTDGSFEKRDNSDEQPSYWRQEDRSYLSWLTSGAHRVVPALEGIPVEGGIDWLDPEPGSVPDATRLSIARVRMRELAVGPPDSTKADEALGLALRLCLDLVYAGRAQEGWAFLRSCFADGLGMLLHSATLSETPRSPSALEQAVVQKINRSPFVNEVLRRNGGSIAPLDLSATP